MCNASWIWIMRVSSRLTGACALAFIVLAVVHAQPVPAPVSQSVPPRDSLGRNTPRGTVFGFLNAARKGDDGLASRYLDTTLGTEAAATLAHQLFVVLDARLPARLHEISGLPEGSRANPLGPEQEVVGTIDSATGPVDIVLERVTRGQTGPIWLVSTRTLETIPAIYVETRAAPFDAAVPKLLTRTRVFGVSLFEGVAVLLGLPLVYFLTVVLNQILTALLGLVQRLLRRSERVRDVLPRPARLLLVVITIRVLISSLPLPLLVRQFWRQAANLVTITAVVWLLLLASAAVERHLKKRLGSDHAAAAVSLLRLGRRMVDALVIVAGLLVTLRLFGINLTPALAGLGVGGIAVALAAQKTLENMIAGGSMVFDRALAVGDFVKLGEIEGQVDHIGLRSTRIRTLDRTFVSVPNGQIASLSVETRSARDKFWFHPIVALRYDTTSEQLHVVLEGIRRLLADHRSLDHPSVRVRFFRLGAFSFDVEVFAYVFARDWAHFLEIQEQLLFTITQTIETAGTRIATPHDHLQLARAAPGDGSGARN